MTEKRSLGARLKAEVSNNLTVSIVSVLLALVALAPVAMSESVTVELFLPIAIAVIIPWVYEEHWPVNYSPVPAVVWTLSAALVTAGLYLGIYQLATSFLATDFTGGIAFVVTVVLQYGLTALFARIRRDA